RPRPVRRLVDRVRAPQPRLRRRRRLPRAVAQRWYCPHASNTCLLGPVSAHAAGTIKVVTAVATRVRADLRTRWFSWLALALLAGAFGGAVTAAAAGARRTDSAYPRFLEAEKAPDVLVFTPPEQASAF